MNDPNLKAPSLSERLDALTDLAREAHDLWQQLSGTDRFSYMSNWTLAAWPFDPTARMSPPEDARLNESYLRSMEARKEAAAPHPLLPAVAQPYWVEHFALAAGQTLELSASDVDALIELQKLRSDARSRRDRLRPQHLLAGVLVAASLVASQVPKELFERLEWNYGTFRITVFILVAVSTVLLVWLWAATRIALASEARVLQIVEAVLTYLKISYERNEGPRG